MRLHKEVEGETCPPILGLCVCVMVFFFTWREGRIALSSGSHGTATTTLAVAVSSGCADSCLNLTYAILLYSYTGSLK